MKLRLLFYVAALLAAAGCSAGTPLGFDGGAATDGGSDDSSTTPDGSTTEGGTTATKGGGVYLTSWDYTIQSTPVLGMSASASFVSAYGTGTGSCTTTKSGTCTIYQCPIGGASDAGTPPPASAGTIAITGGSKTVQLVPSGATYAAQSAQQTLWNGGETIEAKSSGAEVPAFDLKVAAPAYVTVTTPVFPAPGGKVTINRAQTFPVAWTGGASGDVTVGLTGSTASASTSISCIFPASSGSGSIPSSVLANLPSSPTSATISVTSSSATETIVSGWSVRLQLLTLSKTATGTASAQATIQ